MKMKKMIAALLVVAAGLGVNTANAGYFVSGSDLIGYCEPDSSSNACRAYIIGVLDVFERRYFDRHEDGCVPEGATVGQMARVTTKWLNENPEMLHHPAHQLVSNALIESFNCETDLRWVWD